MDNDAKQQIPKIRDLMFPVLEALKDLGGSGHVSEIDNRIAERLGLPDDVVEFRDHKADKLLFNWKCAWARTNLKSINAVENTDRGIWAINSRGREISPDDVWSDFAEYQKASRQAKKAQGDDDEFSEEPSVVEADDWQSVLLETMKGMPPDAFERLAQRILRESNFSKVEVTGKSGDGGIDGTGVLNIGLISFQVLFQCKRYRETVGAREIRDFRGAMVGRTDKGLFITTGRFTPDSRREATRDGAPPIDLVDGDQLCVLLKKLGLGVSTELVEKVTVDPIFFDQI